MGQIGEASDGMRVGLVSEGVRVVYVPDGAALEERFSLGKLAAEKLVERSDG